MRVTMVLGDDFLFPYLDDRVFREAVTLKREGWEVSLVCWARTITNRSLDHLPPVTEYKGIQVHRIYQNISPTKSMLIIRIIQHLKGMRKMAKKIKETKPDVIHYNDFNTLFSIVFGGKKGGPKILYDSHEDYPSMIKSAVPHTLAKIAARFERYIVKNHADAVITVSPPILKRLTKLGIKKSELILNCKDLKDYDIPRDRIIGARKKLIHSADTKASEIGISNAHSGVDDVDSKFILLYIGSLGENRGLRELLAAVKSLDAKENVILVIGGHGSIQDELKAAMEDIENAFFIGEVSTHDVPLYTKACDCVFMMMNPKEEWHKIAMPNKLFEAMAAGKPIIASSGTLYAGVVKKEECGVVVPYGDIHRLIQIVMELVKNPELRNKLGENGLKAAERGYNWESQGKKLVGLYQRLGEEIKVNKMS
ncbi:MAG: glycosyltransferase family 4 protein [Methanomassiliicoccales archaeon]|nr:MAG: glycosyltransferase family 4 protein [Methanomassiliicoccales archaeon]